MAADVAFTDSDDEAIWTDRTVEAIEETID
jgi:hypothetical protein